MQVNIEITLSFAILPGVSVQAQHSVSDISRSTNVIKFIKCHEANRTHLQSEIHTSILKYLLLFYNEW